MPRGAHEPIGEAWLLAGKLPQGRESPATLGRLPFFPCEGHADLTQAVSRYEAGTRR